MEQFDHFMVRGKYASGAVVSFTYYSYGNKYILKNRFSKRLMVSAVI